MVEDKRYYTYFHIDLLGNVRYVGSGTGNRYKAKNYRSKIHLSFWESLVKVVVDSCLTKEESMNIEQKYIEQFIEFGQLFNVLTICNHKTTKPVKFLELKDYLYIDETSPSGLRWGADVFSGVNYNIKEVSVGDIAGRKSVRGYWHVSLNKIRYANHRIVYCLLTHKDIPCDMVVDHIDGNPSNNSIANLRLTTRLQNNRHNTISKANKTGHKGIQLSNQGTWVVTWREMGKTRSKTFNPRTLYKNQTNTVAKDLALHDAIAFRKHIEKFLYLIEEEV